MSNIIKIGFLRMNKFVIFACLKLDKKAESQYDGSVVILVDIDDPAFMLFFPVSEQDSEVISYILNKKLEKGNKVEYDPDINILGIYATMLESWRAGNRYLSGVVIDTIYNEDSEKEIPLVRLVLSNQKGLIDSLVRVNFIHAVLLAAMEDVEIIISDKLLNIMLPETEGMIDKISDHNDMDDFPEDQNIINIAKEIMNGRISDDNDVKTDKKDSNKSDLNKKSNKNYNVKKRGKRKNDE